MVEIPGKYVVVFDNNAYGDLIAGVNLEQVDIAIEELRSAEDRDGAYAVASPLVMMELVALLEDSTAQAYGPAYSAIVALWQHTRIQVDGVFRIGSFSDPVSMICQQLFEISPTNSKETLDLLTQVCTYIGRDRPSEIDDGVMGIVHAIAEHVRGIEARFVHDLFELVVTRINPDAKDWAPLRNDREAQAEARRFLASEVSRVAFAEMQLDNCLDALDKTLSPEDRKEATRLLARKLSVGAALFNEILLRIDTTGCDLEKKNRRNWVWDLWLALGVGTDHSVQNKGIHLVTTDGAILQAAQKAGCSDLVYSYTDYRRRLGLSAAT